jgi:hypothetical protein
MDVHKELMTELLSVIESFAESEEINLEEKSNLDKILNTLAAVSVIMSVDSGRSNTEISGLIHGTNGEGFGGAFEYKLLIDRLDNKLVLH